VLHTARIRAAREWNAGVDLLIRCS